MMDLRSRTARCGLLLALAFTGCAVTPPPSPSDPELTSPADETVGPFESPLPALPAGPSLPGALVCDAFDISVPADVLPGFANAELGPGAPQLALRTFLVTEEAAQLALPRAGWRLVSASPDAATFLARGREGWVVAVMAPSESGRWEFFEGGLCPLRVELPEEIGFATWRLDPDRPPPPDGRIITVLATEIACASGQPPRGRLLPPVVLSTTDAVTIAIGVRKRGGDQECQGSPEVPVTVELPEPLGNRLLFDGSAFPAEPRH
jgi:hypothetical protein